MEKRFEAGDGKVVRVRLPGDPDPAAGGVPTPDDDAALLDDVFDDDGYDGTGGESDADRDLDELDEGATQAVILVTPKVNTMTVEGAVQAVGIMARHVSGHGDEAPAPQGWWKDWGMYVIPMVAIIIAMTLVNFLR